MGGKQRIVVGLSGGVDSAVTAWLLKQQGHEVVGIFMKNWEDDDGDEYCSSNIDFVDAAAVADVIGIEIEHVNFAADYKDRVFADFLREYQAGRTPNPDILCNAEIKFKAFLDHAIRLGADRIATGHYARVRRVPADPGMAMGRDDESPATAGDSARVRRVPADPGMGTGREDESPATAGDSARVRRVPADPGMATDREDESPATASDSARVLREPADPGMGMGMGRDDESSATAGGSMHRWRYQLLKGLDPLKDQSYFLHRLNQAQLSRTLFPIGDLPKTEVRRLAAEIGLPNAKKKDSTGICFIGERPFREFLNRYLANRPGPVLDDRGRTIGEHIGLSFYTLGQRKGIGIGGVKEAGAVRGGNQHAPWFVARKDMDTNRLYVVQGHDHPWLLSHRLRAGDVSWVAGHAPASSNGLSAKTRFRQADSPCILGSGKLHDRGLVLEFHTPQWAVTPGQSAVIYDAEVCLGGAVINDVG